MAEKEPKPRTRAKKGSKSGYDAKDITGVALPVDAGHLILPGFNHAPG